VCSASAAFAKDFRDPGTEFSDGELYDLKADPGETTNFFEEHPDVFAELRAAYDQWWIGVQPLLVNKNATGPRIDPFQELYYKQFCGSPLISSRLCSQVHVPIPLLPSWKCPESCCQPIERSIVSAGCQQSEEKMGYAWYHCSSEFTFRALTLDALRRNKTRTTSRHSTAIEKT
jgi:hypothetical protein